MISLIVAIDKNHLIGNSQGMPWYIKEDLAYFREVTRGKTVIMGRKTFQTIGRPLPNRHNVVLTRHTLEIEGVEVIHDLETYLKNVKQQDELFIIGGAEIYRLAYPYVQTLYVTHIEAEFKGDVYFPSHYFDGTFEQVDSRPLLTSEGINLKFTKCVRRDINS